MKKVIFLFAMVLTVGFAMAQNTATVNQTGTSNSGTVNQSGASNNATIDQYGTNLGQILQTGTGNIGNIDQGTLAKPVTNVPTTYYNVGAWIKQVGETNNASIVSQNDGSIHNSGSGNAGSIDQNGKTNTASQVLGSHTSQRAKTSARVAVEIDQLGDGNKAWQLTRGNFGSHGIQQMWVDQIGVNNYANQYSNGGMASVMTVKQEGSGNGNAKSADVNSTGLASPLSLPWGTKMHPANAGGINAGKILSGEYTQYQNGRYSEAIINVKGDDNKTTQAQEFTSWSLSGQNKAYIDILGNTNAVIQAQMGEKNTSDVDITGSYNVVASSQLGDVNAVDIDITGSFNTVGVEQVGNWHIATVLQTGNYNFAQIIQK